MPQPDSAQNTASPLPAPTPTSSAEPSTLTALTAPSPKSEPSQPIVIIGAGTIGRLMAGEALLGGRTVHLIDQNPAAIETSKAALKTLIETEVRDDTAREGIFKRLTLSAGDLRSDQRIHSALEGAACVIEALPEIKELKESILGELDRLVPAYIPITTVSSSFPVRELLEKATFKERFLNTHPLQRGIAAVEIMPSAVTNTEVKNGVTNLFEAIGMVPIDVQKENVGFIFNIAWRNIKKTVLDLVDRGVNTPQDFDRIWMMAFKTKNGPFGLMDLVGLDVVLAIEERYAKLSEKKEDIPPPFLKRMVELGELGLKAGRGFYSYPNPEYKQPGFLERGRQRNADQIAPIRDTLIGSWELVSFTATKAGSDQVIHPMGVTVKGTLQYSLDGGMSVALVRESRALFSSSDPLAGTSEERAAAFSGYFGYVGTFRYRNGVVYHDVEHCSFPNWSGCTLIRFASLSDEGLLTLSTQPVEVAGSIGIQNLVWRRRG
jgi:3-hydroxybutyryl-CoA dehydrogenase